MTRLLGFQVLLGLAVCAHPKVHVIRLQTPKLLSYEDVPQIPSIAKDSALLCSSVASANCAALHARPSHRSFQTTVKTGEDVSEMIDLTQVSDVLGGMLRDFGFSEDEIDAAIETAGRFEFRISEDNADDNADTDAASSGSDEEQTRLRIEEDDLQITADADYFKDLYVDVTCTVPCLPKLV
ncbi:MAG: hypothetical protein MHM6MM_000313 [Cercozoa sp. M6MM]